MTDIANLEAWAIRQGYNPTLDYTQPDEIPDGYLSPHFSEKEFACHHCGGLVDISQELLNLLESIRAHYGDVPVTINSGYRCPEHNASPEVNGAANSQHLYGTAADIVVSGVSPDAVYAVLDPIHNGGLGKYDTFTHVDVRGSRARWSG